MTSENKMYIQGIKDTISSAFKLGYISRDQAIRIVEKALADYEERINEEYKKEMQLIFLENQIHRGMPAGEIVEKYLKVQELEENDLVSKPKLAKATSGRYPWKKED